MDKSVNAWFRMTSDNIAELQVLYDKALKNKSKQFIFKGQDVLTSYAKYIILYIKDHVIESDIDNHINVQEWK